VFLFWRLFVEFILRPNTSFGIFAPQNILRTRGNILPEDFALTQKFFYFKLKGKKQVIEKNFVV